MCNSGGLPLCHFAVTQREPHAATACHCRGVRSPRWHLPEPPRGDHAAATSSCHGVLITRWQSSCTSVTHTHWLWQPAMAGRRRSGPAGTTAPPSRTGSWLRYFFGVVWLFVRIGAAPPAPISLLCTPFDVSSEPCALPVPPLLAPLPRAPAPRRKTLIEIARLLSWCCCVPRCHRFQAR